MTSTLRAAKRLLGAAVSAASLWSGVTVLAGSVSFEGTEFMPAGKAAGDQTSPSLAVGSGRSALVWQENTDGDGNAVKVRLLGSQFTAITADTFVNTTKVGDQEHPACVALADGAFLIVWQSGARGTQKIVGRVLGNDGIFRTGEIEISEGAGARDAKLLRNRDASLTVLWTQLGVDADMEGVVARSISATGAVQGVPVRLNATESFNQRDPVAASLADGSLLIAWVSENPNGAQPSTVVARKFSPGLSAVSGEMVLTPGKNPCSTPALVTVADRLLLAWAEFQMDEPDMGWDLMAKPITEQGAPLATARRITARRLGDQGDLRFASYGDVVLAAFTSTGLDGSGLGIGLQSLDANGKAIELDLVVNTTKRQNQVQPALGISSTGDALVAWVGFGSAESGVDLYAQRIGRPDAALPAPSAPLAIALSASKIRITCPDAAGLPVAKYLIFVDGNTTPNESLTPYLTLSGFAPESSHGFELALLMQDGRISPKSSEQRTTTFSDDDNADGLPDSWQRMHFGSTPANWPAPSADSDGDGISNRDEFLAGTIPTDADSALRTHLQETELGTVLSWNSLPGGLYQIQASSDLTEWTDVGGIRLASGLRESVLVQAAPANSYYRVNSLR